MSYFIISVSLKCFMDLQSSDGCSMLLKYITSYVTKMKDHNIAKDLLFIIHVDDLYFFTIFCTICCNVKMYCYYFFKVFPASHTCHSIYNVHYYAILTKTVPVLLLFAFNYMFPTFLLIIKDIDTYDISGYTIETQYL